MQQVMDAVLYYAKILFTVQSYTKSQYYFKAMVTPSDPMDTRCADAADTSKTSEEVSVLKTNDDGTFTLDEVFIPSSHSYRNKFILGGFLRFFGVHVGRIIWVHHSIKMRKTRTVG